MPRDPDYDAVVIGGGHNGLVAAADLAGAGLRVCLLERRDVVGGAAVTEELVPGFRVSTASYSLSLLRPDIAAALDLPARGVRLRPKDPQLFVPLPDGRHFFVWRDQARTVAELARIHPADAAAYPRWCAFWGAAVAAFRPLVECSDPPGPEELEAECARRGLGDLWRLAVAGSAEDLVAAFFAADEVRGAFASQGIIGTDASPRHPGTAWIMTYHALGGELNGAAGTWSYVEGGMGSVTRAMAAAARERGAVIRTGAAAEAVIVEGGAARGVRLASGEEVRAPVVASNADPVATFRRLVPAGTLPDAFEERVRAWRLDGAVVKVNLALGEAPDYRARPALTAGALGPQHRGTLEVSPSVGYLHDAWQQAAGGTMPEQPFMELFLQTSIEPSMAPPGGHVASVFAQWAPRVPGPGSAGEALAAVLTTLAEYAPNLPGAVVASEVLLPADLEARFGLTGGDIFHGSMLPDQSFGARFDYRTPLPGLYLCGSGARPGGCVMGAAGRNAARRILSDARAAR
jgi:phytoene dehydrogenase-like protein